MDNFINSERVISWLLKSVSDNITVKFGIILNNSFTEDLKNEIILCNKYLDFLKLFDIENELLKCIKVVDKFKDLKFKIKYENKVFIFKSINNGIKNNKYIRKGD